MKTDELRKRATEAKNKKAEYGDDIDLDEYSLSSDHGRMSSLDDLSESDRELVKDVGFDPSEDKVAGSFIQFDNESILADVLMAQEGLEVLPLAEALTKYNFLKDYLWNAVPVDADKYTARSELVDYNGYFIRAKARARIEMPVQSCLIMKKDQSLQNVHNIVIAEEGSELHIITGCATPSSVEQSLHLGISEFYVKRKARLTFTMVHRWNEKTDVRPRSATVVEEGGTYISSYAILSPLRSIQTFPKVHLRGRNAKADLYSVVYGSQNSVYDIGGLLSLEAPKTQGKVVSRSIATDTSRIIARGDLVGLSGETKARLECDGLLISSGASIRAVPMLHAMAEGAELSHEATVGKVGAEQLSYLMSRGLDEEEATSLIIRGFVKLKVPDLPPALQSSIDEAIRLSLEGGM
ncbi:MAG: SufB/SufD family protein [Candidatus Thorarchaeota archaeon]|nr:MAG: SufD family Fe-S cluster assembly protein [Candidatus Thorarchaeota archaeon]RLI55962.1 MAG: SufD family Fe-S cluster assembly protein [Candidatus Thorarchaeota archaeon]